MSRYSSYKDFQLMTESWRRYLNEQEEQEEKPMQLAKKGLININAGPGHVLKAVPQLLQDPKLKDIVRAGRTDAGGPADEIIEIKPGRRTAAKLAPTQSQIGTGQSLDDQASDEDFGTGKSNLDRAIKGGMLASAKGEFPILVFGNHILDGHHRWSQFITTNPGATVNVAEIVAPGVKDPKTALALLHYMNFALFGKSPTKDFEGDNVYGMDRAAIYQQALSKMADSTVAKLAKAGLIQEPTKEAAAAHMANNLSKIPGPGANPRLLMPQPGDAGSEDGYATTPEPAAQGIVNYLSPRPEDIKG